MDKDFADKIKIKANFMNFTQEKFVVLKIIRKFAE